MEREREEEEEEEDEEEEGEQEVEVAGGGRVARREQKRKEKMEKRPLTCVDLDAGLDQHAHAVELAVAAGKVQRGPVLFVE
jgi:hypothetical protein